MRVSATSRKGFTLPAGFTLIEVLVVIVIIGLAGAIVVPQLMASSSLGLQAASRLVIADILHAQNDAVAQQAGRQVVFEPQENRYRLTDGAGNTLAATWKGGQAGAGNYVVNLSQDSRFPGLRMENADFGGNPVLVFDDLGAPANGGSVDLVAGSQRFRITVAAFTGRVTVASVSGG